MIVCTDAGLLDMALCEVKSRLVAFGIAIVVAAAIFGLLFINLLIQERRNGKR